MTDLTYEAESLHTPESRDRDARLVGHEPKEDKMTERVDRETVERLRDWPLCGWNEVIQLRKDAADYIESLLAERDALEAQNQRLRNALAEQSMSCTCHEAYTSRHMQDPECPAGEYGDDCRAAIGLPPLCQHNIRLAEQEKTDDQ